jgi:orotidine-5'-phosphate decarboxylase
MQSKLIIALDFDNQTEALAFIDHLNPSQCALKVGLELYTHLGPAFIRLLVARNYRVFLDLKYHDIPNTVARACKMAADLGVWMLNVHASGGLMMMQAAKDALDSYGSEKPLLIAVTALTSMNAHDLQTIGINTSLQDHVCHLASLTKTAGLDGVVSSALEVSAIKEACGKHFLTITPGIRMQNDKSDDQRRIVTPEMALHAGSDYLVVGRPITRAERPGEAMAHWLNSLSSLSSPDEA